MLGCTVKTHRTHVRPSSYHHLYHHITHTTTTATTSIINKQQRWGRLVWWRNIIGGKIKCEAKKSRAISFVNPKRDPCASSSSSSSYLLSIETIMSRVATGKRKKNYTYTYYEEQKITTKCCVCVRTWLACRVHIASWEIMHRHRDFTQFDSLAESWEWNRFKIHG